MDREDARFIALALNGRIQADRVALDRLCASSFVLLTAAGCAIERNNSDAWPPATAATAELKAIASSGGAVADVELTADRRDLLETFVRVMDNLAGEKVAPNRFERRRAASIHLPRRERLVGRSKSLITVQ